MSRELASHIGADRRFASDAERRAFDDALALYCREAARIVEAYAGGWYGKTVWRDERLDRAAALLFSGGLDSLAGALDELLARRNRVVLISHHSATRLQRVQAHLVGALRDKIGRDRLHHVPPKTDPRSGAD